MNLQAAKIVTRMFFGISLFIQYQLLLMMYQIPMTKELIDSLSLNEKIFMTAYGVYHLLGKALLYMGIFHLIISIFKRRGVYRKYSKIIGYYGLIFIVLHFTALKIVRVRKTIVNYDFYDSLEVSGTLSAEPSKLKKPLEVQKNPLRFSFKRRKATGIDLSSTS